MTHTTSDGENARAFLDSLRRGDLSALLLHAQIDIGVTSEGYLGNRIVVVVRAPQPFAEALDKLAPHDRKRIAEAALSNRSYDAMPASDIKVKAVGDTMSGPATILPDLIIHREMMVAVATGKQQIQEVDDYYVARQLGLTEGCAAAGIKYDNPHLSLWDWFHFWKAQGMDSYAERRNYVRQLFNAPCCRLSDEFTTPALWPNASRQGGSAWTDHWARRRRSSTPLPRKRSGRPLVYWGAKS